MGIDRLPESEIPHIIHLLTQSPPSTQLATLNRFFIPTASFTHPFVRTGSWDLGNGFTSRWAMAQVYRWYKIMSPQIALDVTSVAYDKTNTILYVGVEQSFRIFPIAPLGYRADVSLTTKLLLQYNEQDSKYYIKSQDDLYQTTEFSKFVWFGIWRLVWVWQFLSTVICLLLAYLGAPISWLEERYQVGEVKNLPKRTGHALKDGEMSNQTEGSNKVNGPAHPVE
jgi:hypothetical protein